MIQLNNVANVGVHRTCTPLYEKYEATPYNTFLDPTETGNVYSGMVMVRSGADTVKIYDSATATNSVAARGFGLAAFDRNANIDDLSQVGMNSVAVWLGGENAFFTIGAPAFDTGASLTVPTDGSRTYLYAGSASGGSAVGAGVLTTYARAGSNTYDQPVAELIDVLGATQIVIRLIPAGAK